MTTSIPRIWCETGTKTDPGAAAALTGFVSGNPVSSASHNFLLNQLTAAERAHMTKSLLQLRTLQKVGDTNDDAQNFIAALSQGYLTVVLTANTNGVLQVGNGSDKYDLLGAFTSIEIGAAADADGLCVATDGTRILALGQKGGSTDVVSDSSDDGGVTWTTRGVFSTTGPLSGCWLLWDETHSVFIGIASSQIKTSADGVTWSADLSSGTDPQGGRLACLTSGLLLGIASIGNIPPCSFRKSSNAAVTWADTGGTVANSTQMTTLSDKGSVCGSFSTFYHVGRVTAGLQVSSSPDGDTWTTLSTITPASVNLTDFETLRPYILQCPDTGLLVVTTLANNNSLAAIFASFDGVDWLGPAIMSASGSQFQPDEIAVANGRIFAKSGFQIFATDGL